MNSLEVTRHLHQSGLISKEAALRILKKRSDLIKTAMVDMTNRYFGFDKYAFPFGGKGQGAAAASGAAGQTAKATRTWMQPLKNIAPLLGLAGLITLGSTAAKVGLGALGDLKMREDLDKSYANVFQEFPELNESKGQASKYFSMMSKYAPSLAANPIVAGTWIKQMMNANVVDPKSIHALISAQSDWEDIRSMKSPLLSFTRDFPATKDIFSHMLQTQMGGSE